VPLSLHDALPISEKIHHRASTGKGNHDQIRGNISVGSDPVKFIRLMEGDLSPFQSMYSLICPDRHFSLVNADEFPEVMRFTRKGEGAHIFKVMKREQIFNMKVICECKSLVLHDVINILFPFIIIIQQIKQKCKMKRQIVQMKRNIG